MNIRPGITQPAIALCAVRSSNQQTKQKYKSSHQQTGLSPHSALPIRGKANKQTKLSTNLTQYEAHTNHRTNLRKAETKRKKEFNPEVLEKETSNTVSYKKIMKRDRNTTKMKEQDRNTEVQINEEKTDKLSDKQFTIMIVKMIKNLENRMEKMQESINKDLEELKSKHTNTTINEIKNILEGINSRISKEEE